MTTRALLVLSIAIGGAPSSAAEDGARIDQRVPDKSTRTLLKTPVIA